MGELSDLNIYFHFPESVLTNPENPFHLVFDLSGVTDYAQFKTESFRLKNNIGNGFSVENNSLTFTNLKLKT